MSNVTQTGAVGEVVVTQTGQEAAVTVVTARGPAGSTTVDQTIIDGSANAVSGNAVFDGLALKAPIANPTFTGIVTAPRITGRCDGLEVFCKAGLAISAGQVVYVTGASGNNIIIGLAQANAELTSSKTIGISESTLANNATGYVITEGLMTVSISAPTAVEGDPIWLSPTTAGGMVFGAANRPVAPNHMVYLGVVTRKTGNTVIEIFVKVQNGSELDELSDVLITSPTAGQALMRGASLWENRSLVSADISDATSAATPNTIVKRDSQGRALFAATGFGASAVNGTSPDGPGVTGVSTNSAALNGTSTNGFGVSSFSTSGTGLSAGSSSGLGGRTRTVSGTNHHEFGTITGDDRSFVRRVLGLFGWNRGSFVQTLGSPATLTADSAISLPDIASGTVALTTDEMTPTAAGIASKINGATAKTTLVDADETVLTDSAASFGLKKVTWANVFAYIQTKLEAAASIVFTGQLRSTNQTAATADALMTRSLTGIEHFYNLGSVFRVLSVPAFATSGTTGANSLTIAGDRWASFGSGSANSGWARAQIGRGITNSPVLSGGGIAFSRPQGVAVVGFIGSTNFTNGLNIFRIRYGSDSTPVADGVDAVSYRGFGIEFKSRGTSHDWRVYGHNGTAISYSSWTNTGLSTDIASTRLYISVISDGAGNITASFSSQGSRTLSQITTTGGPTTAGVSSQALIDVHTANATTGTTNLSANIFDAVFYAA